MLDKYPLDGTMCEMIVVALTSFCGRASVESPGSVSRCGHVAPSPVPCVQVELN